MLDNAKHTYALADFTVEGKAGKWYFWKSARYGDKEERRGPCSNIASVTLMIAWQLKKDITTRNAVNQLPE